MSLRFISYSTKECKYIKKKLFVAQDIIKVKIYSVAELRYN